MPTDDTSDDTVPHGSDSDLGAGLALVNAAEDSDSGGWKAVMDWMASNPHRAGELARHAADAARFGQAIRQQTPTDRSGRWVGGYELHAEIGRGGMGVVYRARDHGLNRDVAVKLLRADGGFTAAEAARFRCEAEVVASLDHPNIVRVLDFDDTDSGPYLVMPLMAGGSLATKLKERTDRRLDPKEAARIVRDIALGVHHAHQRGLIHRDLKPGNILLDAAGTPHVADFGLARRLDATASTAAGIAGTVAYMAPEQGRGEKQLTTAADVYALGVILFELLTGGVPYGGSDVHGILLRLTDVNEPVPSVSHFRPDAPADLAAVCAKCLEKRPDDRYRSAEELADDLGHFLDDRPVSAQPPGFWDWLRQLSRIRPAETYVNTFWPVTAWFGLIYLVTKVGIYALVRSDAAAAWVWVATLLEGAMQFVVLWWYMFRRFRLLTATDRHSLVIAVGGVLLYIPLMVAFVPLSLSQPARDGLGLFPPYAALAGFGLFILGSTHWSRFFLFGSLVIALVPVFARWPEESPLVFGVTLAAVMWYWSYASGRQGHRNRQADTSSPPA